MPDGPRDETTKADEAKASGPSTVEPPQAQANPPPESTASDSAPAVSAAPPAAPVPAPEGHLTTQGLWRGAPASPQPDANVVPFLKPGAYPNYELLEAIRDALIERGAASITSDRYCGYLSNFLRWLKLREIDYKTMPSSTAATFLAESYPSPVMRKGAESALRMCFEIALQKNLAIAQQDIPFTAVAPKRTRAQRESDEARRGIPADFKPSYDIFGDPNRQVVPPAARSGGDLAAMVAAAAPPAVEQPAPTRPVAQPRAPTGAARARNAVPGLGGRVRISKRIDGTEGLPMPIGTLVLIGVYSPEDLEGEGSMADFIANQIRPVFGPFRGQRPTVYYVDRLDNVGQPIPNGTTQVPVMPDPRYDRPVVQPAQVQPLPPQVAQAQSGVTGDKFLDYIIELQRRNEAKAEAMAQELRSTMSQRNVDPALLMLIAERAKPEPLDIPKLAAEWRRLNRGERDDHELDDFFGEPSRLPGTPSRANGFAGLEPTRERDGFVEAVTSVLKEQGQMLRDLVLAKREESPREQLGVKDIIEVARMMMPPPAPPPPSDPVKDALLAASVQRITQPPEKPKTLTDLLGELKLFWEAKDAIGGEEKPISWGEIAAALIEHAPEVGRGVSTVLESLKNLHAPRLDGEKLPGTKVAPVQKEARRSETPPLNDTAKKGFLTLRDAGEPQLIVDTVFAILKSYGEAPEPWPTLAKKVVEHYKAADTRLEVQVVITNLFVLSGAKALMTAEAVERVTDVFAENYPMLHEALTGQPKALKDTAKLKRNGFQRVAAAPEPAKPLSSCTCDPTAAIPDPRCPDHGEPIIDEEREVVVREPAQAQAPA